MLNVINLTNVMSNWISHYSKEDLQKFEVSFVAKPLVNIDTTFHLPKYEGIRLYFEQEILKEIFTHTDISSLDQFLDEIEAKGKVRDTGYDKTVDYRIAWLFYHRNQYFIISPSLREKMRVVLLYKVGIVDVEDKFSNFAFPDLIDKVGASIEVLKTWYRFFESLDPSSNILIRTVNHNIENTDEFYPKQISLILEKQLFPLFNHKFSVKSQLNSCLHQIRTLLFFEYVFMRKSEEGITDIRDCEFCGGNIFDFFPAIFFNQKFRGLRHDINFENVRIFKSVRFDVNIAKNYLLVNPSGILHCNDQIIGKYDTNYIVDGYHLYLHYEQNTSIIEMIGQVEVSKIDKLEYNATTGKLTYEISQFLPNLLLKIIPQYPQQGVLNHSKWPKDYELKSKRGTFKIELNQRVANYYGILMQTDNQLDSETVKILKPQKQTAESILGQLKNLSTRMGMEQNRLLNFIHRFTDLELPYLIKLLTNCTYYGISDCVDPIYRKILPILSNFIDANCYIGSVTPEEDFKSGNVISFELMSRFTRKVNVRHLNKLSGDNVNHNDALFLVDDLTGTGNQFVENYKRQFPNGIKANVYFICYYMYEEGIENIKKNLPNVFVLPINRVNRSSKILTPNNLFIEDDIPLVTQLLKKYGSKEYYQGYNYFGGSTLINTERVSNLVPDMFWRTRENWPILFFRPD
ncbi:MAG: hypothetical protein HeimC2_34280 [Candidatus Heimdallarchaeota archaeon LC_2]|nr:MAG: hypothetical protein HeimC2_34280 [Candidatus Heimdallarchaeota archaeon LC_2]